MLKDIKSDPRGSVGKESACNAGDLGSVPELERSSREGKGYPLQNSGLENSMDSPWSHKESDTTDRLTHTHPSNSNKDIATKQLFFFL